jgi:hypothetical protein
MATTLKALLAACALAAGIAGCGNGEAGGNRAADRVAIAAALRGFHVDAAAGRGDKACARITNGLRETLVQNFGRPLDDRCNIAAAIYGGSFSEEAQRGFARMTVGKVTFDGPDRATVFEGDVTTPGIDMSKATDTIVFVRSGDTWLIEDMP